MYACMPSGEALCCLFSREIVRPVEIINESGSGWAPSQDSLGLHARTDKVATNEHPYPAKMGCCLLGGLDTTGTFMPRPMASAMSRNGTPSSAIA